MSEKITQEVFDRLVQLASLELQEEEADYLCKELNLQLVSIEVLEGIPLDEGSEIAAHGIPYTEENSPRPRKDEVRGHPHRQDILDQAPELEDGYIVVPDISHEELE